MNGTASVIGVSTVTANEVADPKDYWGFALEAAARALADAGLTPADIDGVVFITSVWPPERLLTSAAHLAQLLRITPAWTKMIPYGGTPISEHLMWASIAIEKGLATNVLCVASENLNARLGRSGVVEVFASTANSAEWEYPFGPLLPSNFGMIARRYMHEYGVAHEQISQVAVANRKWAQLNPQAIVTKPLTVEDVLASKTVSAPLNMLDLSLVSDGAAAAVVTSADRARDAARPPVRIMGFGECTDSQNFSFHPNVLTMPALSRATEQALGMAGLARSDLDIVYPYDPSTVSVLVELEAMGFAAPGEAADLIADDATAPGGPRPMNTHGGLLSCSHPGPSASMIQMVEAIRQLRGECGERQVAGARRALCLGEGGFYSWQVTVLGSDDDAR
ncbi:MAG TPA: thiolase family protein [Streptosporangiaceae bacterium]|jgi:acetyl-CoA acetyltransferase